MKTLLIIVLVCFCVTIHLKPIQATGCKSGWLRFENSCYYFSHDAETWAEASIVCVDLHSHLATVGSAAENTFLQSQATILKKTAYWLDGTDFEIENVWRWTTTGAMFTFTGWGGAEPNESTTANCLALWQLFAYKWADENCRHIWNFICETNVTVDGEEVIG